MRKRVAIATPDRSTRSPAPTHPLHPPAQLSALKRAPAAQLAAVDVLLGDESPLSALDLNAARPEFGAYDWAPRLALDPEAPSAGRAKPRWRLDMPS